MEKSPDLEENAPETRKISAKMVSDFLLAFFFCGIMLLFFSFNFKTLNQSFSGQMGKEGPTQQKLLSVESDFQKRIYKRTELINLYGLTLKGLNWKIVGNFDFVKDSHGYLQDFRGKIDTNNFLGSMAELKAAADSAGTPLVYITLPDKTGNLELAKSNQFSFLGQLSKQIGERLKDTIDCLDVQSLLTSDADAPTLDAFHFKTDGHNSTYGEFWTAKMLVKHLQERYGIQFSNARRVFDLGNYDIVGYEFLGNQVRSVGEYFAGTDVFEIYKPKWETSLQLLNPSASEMREGTFEQVMLNGYENNPTINQYTYWITNYGCFGFPCYQYVNKQATGGSPNLLVISDSLFMRGTAYLTLACGKLTVLDPRYFKGNEYVAQMLAAEHYDAIIAVGESPAYYASSFSSKIQLPDLPTKNMITPEAYGGWIGNQGICVDSCNDKRVGGKRDIQLDSNALSVKLKGWAADFCSDAPFKELYLQVGDIIIKCQYGIERTSVVDHFKKDSLLNTGFQVEFPAAYLGSAPDTEIAFIGVSADGQYLYQPVIHYVHRS